MKILRPWRFAALMLLAVVLLNAVSVKANPSPLDMAIYEGLPEKWDWNTSLGEPAERFEAKALGLVRLPAKYNSKGAELLRALPLLVRSETTLNVPKGEYILVLRARNSARLWIDGKVVLETKAIKPGAGGHEGVKPLILPPDDRWRIAATGHQDLKARWTSDGKPHKVEFRAISGGKKLRPEIGETLAAIAPVGGIPVLIGDSGIELTDAGWDAFALRERDRLNQIDAIHRKEIYKTEDAYWAKRHEIARQRTTGSAKSDDGQNPIDRYFEKTVGAKLGPALEDSAFYRRLSLDATGMIPTSGEVEAFLADQRSDKRSRAINERLNDSRWADHWVSYWQDVLAENPGVLKPTLNNTGPFRKYLHNVLADNVAIDRWVTNLIRMEGSEWLGAPAAFGVATQNDSPMAAKAHVIAKAFLAAEMKCARCHDAPQHPFDQADLFGIAAMLANKPLKVPVTSTVKVAEGARTPAIPITLKPGDEIAPHWNFQEIGPDQPDKTLLPASADKKKPSSREVLALLMTSPDNQRFAKVVVNRVWKRLLGYGLVEPIDDWDNEPKTAHKELLNLLARELTTHDYDLKHLTRLILQSRIYQAQAVGKPPVTAGSDTSADVANATVPVGPARRKMSAEQLTDSMFAMAGKPFRTEELTVDPEGRLGWPEFPNLGAPRKSWEFAMMSNERDRPALTLPMVQTITELLEAYGWRNSRQDPVSERDTAITPLQPATLANGIVTNGRITRISDDSAWLELCLKKQSIEQWTKELYLRILSRKPTDSEVRRVVEYVGDTYENRIVEGWKPTAVPRRIPKRVSWSNHLHPEATMLQLEIEKQAQAGDAPTGALTTEFRQRAEDVIWAMINSPEFAFVP